jgi:hypothetical protein
MVPGKGPDFARGMTLLGVSPRTVEAGRGTERRALDRGT